MDFCCNGEQGRISLGDSGIQVSGWDSIKDGNGKNNDWLDLVNISLPSFSGLLQASGNDNITVTSPKSPLLQYPLTIKQPSSIGLDPSKSLDFGGIIQNTVLQEVQALLEGSRPLVSVIIHDVQLVAGVPEEVVV